MRGRIATSLISSNVCCAPPELTTQDSMYAMYPVAGVHSTPSVVTSETVATFVTRSYSGRALTDGMTLIPSTSARTALGHPCMRLLSSLYPPATRHRPEPCAHLGLCRRAGDQEE